MSDPNFDVLIVGGGMVGASLAQALKHVPLRLGLVEAVPVGTPEQPSFDVRAIALAYGSKRIFEAIGVWSAMESLGVTPIRRIHVSDRGRFGRTHLKAAEEGVEALGYVAEAGVIGWAVAQDLGNLTNVELICPATVTAVQRDSGQARLTVDCEGKTRTLTARLLVAADGGRSTVRELLGARTFRLGYGQTAVIANVLTDRPHGEVAYERFTETGPLAMLPNTAAANLPGDTEGVAHGDRRWSLVWTVRNAQTNSFLALDDETFLARLQRRLGHGPGQLLATTSRTAYPLALQYVRDHVQQRVVFIGNAAHTIHPVAGQGFNLGLRDVAVLAEVLAGAVGRGEDPGAPATLESYRKWRRFDYLRVMGMTDTLARTFSNSIPPLALARNLGMLAMDMVPAARHLLARQAMGLTGRLPRLARGLPLGVPLP